MKTMASLAAMAASMLLAGPAQALTWIVDYQAQAGAPSVATLTLSASDTLNAAGGFDITSITGAVDGDTVTGLIANPNQPWPSYSSDGMFIFDNVVWPTSAPVLSNPGIFFHGASGDEYNLFSDNASTYELYRARSGVGYLANSWGTLRIAQGHAGDSVGGGAVPEPAVWAILIMGFGGIGAMLRRRRAALA